MKNNRFRLTLLLCLVSIAAFVTNARAQTRLLPCTNIDLSPPVPAYSWMGASNAQSLTVTSRTGACLNAVIYSPTTIAQPLPAVVIVQGAGGSSRELGWAGRYLAGHGYLTLVMVQQGQGGSEILAPSICSPANALALLAGTARLTQVCPGLPPAFNIDSAEDAAVSGIDYLFSSANPFAIDTARIGAAGHSEGARGVAAAQADDNRIDAIVALDNLSSDRSGDVGLCSGGGIQSALTGGQIPGSSWPIAPRVPAMGQACDSSVGAASADTKEFAFNKWRNANLPTAELVFSGWNHFAWADEPHAAENSSLDVQHQIASYYAGAWFDRYLRGDSSGFARLLATTLTGIGGAADGTTTQNLLSTKFQSGVYLPGAGPGGTTIDCSNFRNGC